MMLQSCAKQTCNAYSLLGTLGSGGKKASGGHRHHNRCIKALERARHVDDKESLAPANRSRSWVQATRYATLQTRRCSRVPAMGLLTRCTAIASSHAQPCAEVVASWSSS